MNAWLKTTESRLVELGDAIGNLSPRFGRHSLREASSRLQGWLAATRFHFLQSTGPILTAFLGGTGTGKSTLLNRLLETEVSTVSFRRTYTNGAVAVVSPKTEFSENWLGIPHKRVEDLPVRGEAGALAVVSLDRPLLESTTLVDTPDLDGERVEHHTEADRAFRWTNRIVFLVTPEKYQMTELLPYYRLSSRYEIPALFLMNKCEEQEVFEDYKKRLAYWGRAEANVFALPRDDSSYQPPDGKGLDDFRKALSMLQEAPPPPRSGLANRCRDAAGRVRDQLLAPLKEDRKTADATLAALDALNPASPNVDVSPITEGLQARMREKSILYLIGPERIADRLKNFYKNLFPGRRVEVPHNAGSAPDFWQILVDQFFTVQSQFDDLLRSNPVCAEWIESDAAAYGEVKIDPAEAGRIAEREIEDLGAWLKGRWDSNPRDTGAIEKLLKNLPGAERFTKWTEAAPYLLVLVCVGSRAFLGPLDLLVIGGYSLTAWLGEKLSNEVTARVRGSNRRICSGYVELVNRQADRFKKWIAGRAPSSAEIEGLETLLDRFEDALEEMEGANPAARS